MAAHQVNPINLIQEELETQSGENRILRQKLQSKSEALVILSSELEAVRDECEKYKTLTEALQTKSSSTVPKTATLSDLYPTQVRIGADSLLLIRDWLLLTETLDKSISRQGCGQVTS